MTPFASMLPEFDDVARQRALPDPTDQFLEASAGSCGCPKLVGGRSGVECGAPEAIVDAVGLVIDQPNGGVNCPTRLPSLISGTCLAPSAATATTRAVATSAL